MARVEADSHRREQPGGVVVLEVDPEVARAMGFRYVRPVASPNTERPIVYKILTEPQPNIGD